MTRSRVSSGLVEYKDQRIAHEVMIRMIISIHFLLSPIAVVQPEVYLTDEEKSVTKYSVKGVKICGCCW